MAKANLKVMLLRATPDPDEVVALGARLCYAQADLDTCASAWRPTISRSSLPA